TMSVFSETMRPLSLPSIRKVLRKRSSPWNSVPASMNPLRSSVVRPLILIIAAPPAATGHGSTISRGRSRRPRAAGADEELVEPVELGLRGEGDPELAPAPPACDLDARPQGRPQTLLGRARVRVARGRRLGPRRAQEGDAALDLADGQPLARGLAGQGRLLFRLLEGEERAPLAWQAKQAQRVGDGGAVAAHLARDLFLGEPQLLLEAVEGLGFLQRAQLLAL